MIQDCGIFPLLLRFCLLAAAAAPLVPESAHARPEYATAQKLNCTSCHVMPWGGGPRSLTGKVFGSHGHSPARTSLSDAYYGDFRLIYYLPTRHPKQRINGLAVMQASASANVAIPDGENQSEMRGVFTYNLSPLAGSQLREAYLRFQVGSNPEPTPLHLLVGRFYLPFGLLTDEHRTYTRIQTNMTFNTYAVGFAAAWSLSPSWHLDLALVNDFQTGGQFSKADLTFGLVLNARWNSREVPFMLGISGNFQRTSLHPQPVATSLHGVLSFDRLTRGTLSGSLSLERVDAKNWNNPALNTGQVNPGLSAFFFPPSETAALSGLNSAHSVGYYTLLRYNVTPSFTPFYKLDYFDPDIGDKQDSFFRHGLGLEAALNSNLILNLRFELAHVNSLRVADTDTLAAQSDVYAMLRFWL